MTETAARLPTGDVTLVFTDIEGSTRLLHELGDGYVAVLEEHNVRVRRAMTAHGGSEIKNEGDGFLFAFSEPAAAVRACGDVQKALASGGWPHGRPVRVRVGAHHGPVTILERDYVGLTVHEAARVCDAASGGQVIMTDVLVRAAAPKLPPDIKFRHLGAYRLRDFPQARHLHQVTVADLPEALIPLRSPAAQRTVSLPAPPSPLVARDDESREVQRMVISPARLVTLTGPGGVGKTRLAIDVGWKTQPWFEGGIWFVDLSSVSDPDGVVPAIFRAIGSRDGDQTAARLVDHFGDAPVLLVLDNFEQVVPGAGHVADVLDACANVTVLATSRERLGVAGEYEVVLHGLDLDGAVELFTVLAGANAAPIRASDHDVVEAICAQLSGMPLALELVASRLRTRTPSELLDELHANLDVLADDARDRPERQREMRATIAWSWELLDADERRALAALSCTAGRSRPELVTVLLHAANVTREPDVVVSSLAGKSLLQLQPTGEVSLLEMIRQFGRERLRTDETEHRAVVDAHARWCAALVDDAAPHLVGPDAVTWLDRLDRERDNIRAALEHELSTVLLDRIETIVDWWTSRGHWTEARSVLGRILMRGVPDPALRARVSVVCANVAVRLGELETARALVEDAAAFARVSGPELLLARALNCLGDVERITGDVDRGERLYRESLVIATGIGDRRAMSVPAANLGVLTWQNNRFDEARRWWTEALALAESFGDLRGIAILKSDLGLLDISDGELERAESLIVEALATGQRLDDPLVTSQGLINLGEVARKRGDDEKAREYYAAALEVYERVNDLPWVAAALLHLTLTTNDLGEARTWLERALEVARRCDDARRIEEVTAMMRVLEEAEAEDTANAT